jgi:serine/threonine protein kinase
MQGMMVPEADARLLFQQLIVAMDYCHRLGIVNRDVKVGGNDAYSSSMLLHLPPACHAAGVDMLLTCPCTAFVSSSYYIVLHLADPWSRCSLQLDNILLHGDAPAILKLCDFGYSKDGETESDCKTACGTPEYMAPEVSIAGADSVHVGCTLVLSCVRAFSLP